MAENLVVNGVTYNGVDSLAMKNANGETVSYYPDAVRYVAQELTPEQKAQARANIGAQEEQEKETVISDNLFDKSAAIAGKSVYASSSGPQLMDNSEFSYAYVPLRGAGVYRSKVSESNRGESYAARVPILKEDLTFIQNVTGTLTATNDDRAWDVEFTITQEMVDAGAAIYAFDCHTVLIDTMMIVKDREYPSEYIPYGYIEVATDVGKKQDNILFGKTAVFLGTSICAGTTVGDDSEYYGYGWAGLIGEENGMSWKNYGRNGGVIVESESVQAERWLTSQVDKAIAEYPEADYVLFEGGTNEADTMDEAGLGEISSDYATFDTTTFTGALESLILKILTAYPNAKVGYIVAQKMGNPPYDSENSLRRKYFDRAIEVCKKWGIPYVDLWNGTPLNPALSTANLFYTDGQHLTLAGYQRLAYHIGGFMRTMNTAAADNMNASESTSAAAPNWNASTGEAGHVLNRTHYTVTGAVVMEETELIYDEGQAACEYTGGNLIPGNAYDVTYNGQKYTTIASEADGNVLFGNLMATGGSDTGEPFVAIIMEGMLNVVSLDGATEAKMAINECNVVKIPEMFMPDSMGVYTIIMDEGIASGESSMSYDSFAPILYSGGRVRITGPVAVGASAYDVISWIFVDIEGNRSFTIYYFYASEIKQVRFKNGTWTPPSA